MQGPGGASSTSPPRRSGRRSDGLPPRGHPISCGMADSAADRGAPAPEILTFGCRLNAYESEVMRAHARAAGLGDVVIVNSCAVTGEAERQARQAIRKARRARPDARIIVTGCAAQIDPAAFAAMPEVTLVIGNAEKLQAATFTALAGADTARIAVADIMTVRET